MKKNQKNEQSGHIRQEPGQGQDSRDDVGISRVGVVRMNPRQSWLDYGKWIWTFPPAVVVISSQ